MVDDTKRSASDWRTVHGDSSDEEWALSADLVLGTHSEIPWVG